eukprot:SAG11_NODE_1020_length_6158_cov_4.836772_3_plen_109_part_00
MPIGSLHGEDIMAAAASFQWSPSTDGRAAPNQSLRFIPLRIPSGRLIRQYIHISRKEKLRGGRSPLFPRRNQVNHEVWWQKPPISLKPPQPCPARASQEALISGDFTT